MAKKQKKRSDKQKLRDFFMDDLAESRTSTPACRHFGECGGCEFQDVPYDRQLDAKLRAARFILDAVILGMEEEPEKAARLTAMREAPQPDIIASPRQFGYRQRMDYVFAFDSAGLRKANRHRHVVPLEECPLLGERAFAVFQKAKTLAVRAGLESYNYLRHVGELRYFVVRQTRDGQTLLSLVTKTDARKDDVLGVLRQLHDDGDIASGHWLLAPGLGDVSFGQPLAFVGGDSIVETMNGVRLRIGPNTFFQSNPAVAEKAYAAIRDFCPENGEALDLYSGVGGIGLSIARKANRVTSVENVPENVTLARANIADNNAANVTLVLEDSTAYLRARAAQSDIPPPALAVVNPPRPGVEGDGMALLSALGPDRIAYLSCNPFTLFRNLADILDTYAVRSLTIYDMFPQTRHFESLALLEKR